MLIAQLATEAAPGALVITPEALIAAGIAFAVFLTLGIVTWSYRDVYNRHNDKTDAHASDGHGSNEHSNSAGH